MVEVNGSYRFVHTTTSSTATLKVRSYVARSAKAPTAPESRKRKRVVDVVFDVEVRDLVNNTTPDVQHLAVSIPELDVGSCVPLLRTSWLPLVVGDPVLFQIIMLFSASHYASYQNPDQYQAMYIELLQLKQIALAGLISALAATPTSGIVSDNLIAGTAKMGSYEAIYGGVDAYHAHMEGVRRMLQLRGGIQSLGQEGFLARLLHFIDTNSAFLLGTCLHLADSMLPRREPFVLPNPRRFLGLPG
ncbi:hypothetical protein DV737_g4430, partial [Chaetothyriales sp. CBS 132003]